MNVSFLPTEFSSIKNSIIQQFKNSDSIFNSYDFESEGSNLNYLIDFLAYMTTYINYRTAVTVNEAYSNTATIPTNVYAFASSLGYKPKRPTSAYTDVKFRIKGLTFTHSGVTSNNLYNTWLATYKPNENGIIEIPQYTKVTSTPASKTFFLTEKVLFKIDPSDGFWKTYKLTQDLITGITKYIFDSYDSPNTYRVKEGNWTTSIYSGTGNKYQKARINDLSIDNDSDSLKVFNVASNIIENWSDLVDLASTNFYDEGILNYSNFSNVENAPIYILRKVGDYWEMTFGDDVLGKIPQSTDVLNIMYLVTSGSAGNNQTGFNFTTSFLYSKKDSGVVSTSSMPGSTMNVLIDSDNFANGTVGGSEQETLFATKNLAPLSFNTQNRLVEKGDYAYYILNQSIIPIQSCIVSDAYELYDARLGSMFITLCKPFNWTNYEYSLLSVSEKNTLAASIKKRAVGNVDLILKDPDFIKINFNNKIYYNGTQYTQSQAESFYTSTEDSYFISYKGFQTTFNSSQFLKTLMNTNNFTAVTLDFNLSYFRKLNYSDMLTRLYFTLNNQINPSSITNDISFKLYSESTADYVYIYDHNFFNIESTGSITTYDIFGSIDTTYYRRKYTYSIQDVPVYEDIDDLTSEIVSGDIYIKEYTHYKMSAGETTWTTEQSVKQVKIGEIDYSTGNMWIDFSLYQNIETPFNSLVELGYADIYDLFFQNIDGEANFNRQPFYLTFNFTTVEDNIVSGAGVIMGKGSTNITTVSR